MLVRSIKTLKGITKHLSTGVLSKIHFDKISNPTVGWDLTTLGNSLFLRSEKTAGLPRNQ